MSRSHSQSGLGASRIPVSRLRVSPCGLPPAAFRVTSSGLPVSPRARMRY